MRTVFLVVLATLCCTLPLNAAAPALNDYAYGYPLPLVAGKGVYALTIPLEVYEKTTRDDLGDLRVFNGSGEPVPHAIRRAGEDDKIKEIRQHLPFFPLPEIMQPRAADLSLRVSRNSAGAVVSIDTGPEAASRRRTSSSYLFDTTSLTTRPTALELLWDSGNTTSVFNVSLAHSTDLSRWSPLVGQSTLADLTYKGNTIAARRIPLPQKPLAYIRLDCIDCRNPLLLREVTAISGKSALPDQWHWLRLNPEKERKAKGELTEELTFEYRLEAKPLVIRLQLHFAEPNALVRAVIESRPSADAEWRIRAQGDFYSLDLDDKALNNEQAYCPPTSDRHWRLRILADGAGLAFGKQPPQLELGWRHEQLVFIGRGNGPYTLAFGSSKPMVSTDLQENLVLAAMEGTRSESLIRQIEPGPLQTLGGEVALQPHLSSASWKKILLWVVLVAGVALLALMTRTLWREMQAKNP